MRKLLHAALIVCLYAPRAAQGQTPVPISGESKHHRVFENEHVRIFDVTVPAGDSTLYHVHPNDYVYVTFGGVALKAQPLGAAQTDLTLSDGEVRLTKAPITHRVINPSKTAFHNLTIELLAPSGVPLSSTPVGTVVMDSARVRVERIVLEPGKSTAQHEHRGPWLDVGVTTGTATVVDKNGASRRVAYRPASYHWNPAGRVHTLENTGSTRLEIVEIEWK